MGTILFWDRQKHWAESEDLEDKRLAYFLPIKADLESQSDKHIPSHRRFDIRVPIQRQHGRNEDFPPAVPV